MQKIVLDAICRVTMTLNDERDKKNQVFVSCVSQVVKHHSLFHAPQSVEVVIDEGSVRKMQHPQLEFGPTNESRRASKIEHSLLLLIDDFQRNEIGDGLDPTASEPLGTQQNE